MIEIINGFGVSNIYLLLVAFCLLVEKIGRMAERYKGVLMGGALIFASSVFIYDAFVIDDEFTVYRITIFNIIIVIVSKVGSSKRNGDS